MAEHPFTANLSGSVLEYIPPRFLRTVLIAQREIPPGFGEIPIDFNLAGARLEGLEFALPDDGMLYGYIREKGWLAEKLGLLSAPISADMFVNGGLIYLMFLSENPEESRTLRIDPAELAVLLNGCLRVPEQRKHD
jgi:hypothetical protein